MRLPPLFNVTLTLAMLYIRCSNAFQAGKLTSKSYSYFTRDIANTILLAKSNESIITETSAEGIMWQSRKKCWRPTVQDVENISWGKPAKRKGTGSRGVPHRLNHEEERTLFDMARKKGFLEVAGSGW